MVTLSISQKIGLRVLKTTKNVVFVANSKLNQKLYSIVHVSVYIHVLLFLQLKIFDTLYPIYTFT